jgi:ribosomal protein L40E
VICPYCGEDLPAASERCFKCGTALGDADPDLLDVPEDLAAEVREAPGAALPGAPPGPSHVCPHCEAPVRPNAHRCRECGRQIRALVAERPAEAWRQRATLGAAAVGAALLLILAVLIFFASGRGRRGEPVESTATFARIEQALGPRSRMDPLRKQQFWANVAGKYVRWSGRIVEVRDGEVLVEHGEKGREGRALVRLSSGLPERLGPGDEVRYRARLAAFGDDPLLVLDDGTVDG